MQQRFGGTGRNFGRGLVTPASASLTQHLEVFGCVTAQNCNATRTKTEGYRPATRCEGGQLGAAAVAGVPRTRAVHPAPAAPALHHFKSPLVCGATCSERGRCRPGELVIDASDSNISRTPIHPPGESPWQKPFHPAEMAGSHRPKRRSARLYVVRIQRSPTRDQRLRAKRSSPACAMHRGAAGATSCSNALIGEHAVPLVVLSRCHCEH